MARIRTIKPDFFTSEDIVGLTPEARLLYIALWCEADREGRLVWKPKTFKLRYLPADSVDIETLCKELIDQGLVTLYGNGLAFIPSFTSHQHVNPREAKSDLPEPDACSTRADASNLDDDTQVGREGKGKEGEGRRTPTGDPAACPHDDIIELYHEVLPMGRRVKTWTDTRRAHLRARWREDGKRQNLDYWRRFFTHVSASPFLTGRVSGKDRKPFELSLDWLVMPENFAKVIEGKYHDKEAA